MRPPKPGAELDHCAEARIRAFSRFHAACDLSIPIPYLRFAIRSSTSPVRVDTEKGAIILTRRGRVYLSRKDRLSYSPQRSGASGSCNQDEGAEQNVSQRFSFQLSCEERLTNISIGYRRVPTPTYAG